MGGLLVDTHKFYEQSLYFLDTLKTELGTAGKDGWMAINEPLTIDTIQEKLETLNKAHAGSWSDETHGPVLNNHKKFC